MKTAVGEVQGEALTLVNTTNTAIAAESGSLPVLGTPFMPVSYTHLDVYKRQVPLPLGLRLNKAGFVRRGKVTEKPLRVNPRQIANGLANIRALFIHLEADTAHTLSLIHI